MPAENGEDGNCSRDQVRTYGPGKYAYGMHIFFMPAL